MNKIAAFVLLCALPACGAWARGDAALGQQETALARPPASPASASAPADEHQPIVIRALRDPEGMAYASFVAAQTAYEENRRYAPDAPLLFQMKTHSGDLDGLRLTLAGEHTSIAVAYDSAGQFTLPYDQAALQDDAQVLTDKKRGAIYWSPVIRSPGLAPGTLRLGDLRLYCRVSWALEKAHASVGTKMMQLLMGGCDSTSYNTLALPQPGMRVRLVGNGKEEIFSRTGSGGIYSAHRTRWQPPLGDAAWPDDTAVEFLPAEDGFVLDEACRRSRENDEKDAYQHSYGTFDAGSCAWRPN